MADDVTVKTGVTGTDDVVRGMTDIKKSVDDTRESMERAAASGAAIGDLIGRGVSFAIEFVKKSVTETVEWANATRQLAEVTGGSVEQVQRLSVAAKLEGEEFGKVQQAMVGLSQKILEARDRAGTAAEAFKQLKLDPKSFKTSEEAIDAVMGALANMPEGFNRTQVAAELFGRRAAASIIQIAASTEETKKVIRDFGLELTSNQIAALDDFRKSLAIADLASESLRKHVAVELTPALKLMVDEFLRFKSEGDVSETAGRIADAIRKI